MADKVPRGLQYPLPDSTYRRLAELLYQPILFGENSVLVCPPLYGRDHTVRFMRERVWDRKDVLGARDRNFHFAYLTLINTEDRTNTLWNAQLNAELGDMEKLIRDGIDPVILVNIPESVPAETLIQFLDFAQRTYYINPRRIHFILVMDAMWDEADFFRLTAPFRSLFQNVSEPPLYTDSEVVHFIKYWLRQWNFTLPKQCQDFIVAQSGGILLFAKALVRIASRNKYTTLAKLQSVSATHPDYRTQLQLFFARLSDTQQNILKRIANRQPVAEGEVNHLLTMAILTNTASGPVIRSLSLEQFLLNTKKTTRQFLNAVARSDQWSEKEKLILIDLTKNRGQVISRERIGEILWGQEADEHWSDWAIDKTLSRIRKKLASLPDLSFAQLVTVKKAGVKIII